MSTLYFTKDHEYIDVDGNIGTVGITDYAQNQLGDIVFVELADVDSSHDQQDEVCVVESVKVASEIYTPVSGTVTEVNEALSENAALINEAPLEAGWIFKIQLDEPSELKELMDEDEYQDFVQSLV